MQGNDVVQSNNWFGAFKTEAIEGADAFAGAAPGAGEVQRFRKLDIKQNITMQRDDAGTATDTGEPGVPIPIDCDVEWEMPLYPANIAAGNTTHVLEGLFNSAKLKSVITDNDNVTYTPYSANDQTNTPTGTFVKYEFNEGRQAKRLLARGTRSKIEIYLENGKTAYVKGTAKGRYTKEPTTFTTGPALPTSYDDDIQALAITSLALTSDSEAITWKVEKAVIKSAYDFQTLMTGDDQGDQEGVIGGVLLNSGSANADYVIDITLAAGAAAIADLISRMQSGAIIDFKVTASAGGRSYTANLPAGQIRTYTKNDGGVKKYQATIDAVRARGTAGDNSINMVFA